MNFTNSAFANNQSHITAASLAPWFHNLHLPDGTKTCPDHPLGDFPSTKWQHISTHIPSDLSGWQALDMGCNAGFYSFELARRGAHVTGIDVNPHYLAQARWAAGEFGLESQIEFKQMPIYRLAQTNETFDLVLFMGVFYHLRYPLLALDIVTSKIKRLMIFQTLTMSGAAVCADTYNRGRYDPVEGISDREVLDDPGWPKMAFIEHRFVDDPTNWWVPNHAGAEAMLRSSNMRIIKRIESDCYLCEPDASQPLRADIAAERLSATEHL